MAERQFERIAVVHGHQLLRHAFSVSRDPDQLAGAVVPDRRRQAFGCAGRAAVDQHDKRHVFIGPARGIGLVEDLALLLIENERFALGHQHAGHVQGVAHHAAAVATQVEDHLFHTLRDQIEFRRAELFPGIAGELRNGNVSGIPVQHRVIHRLRLDAATFDLQGLLRAVLLQFQRDRAARLAPHEAGDLVQRFARHGDPVRAHDDHAGFDARFIGGSQRVHLGDHAAALSVQGHRDPDSGVVAGHLVDEGFFFLLRLVVNGPLVERVEHAVVSRVRQIFHIHVVRIVFVDILDDVAQRVEFVQVLLDRFRTLRRVDVKRRITGRDRQQNVVARHQDHRNGYDDRQNAGHRPCPLLFSVHCITPSF